MIKHVKSCMCIFHSYVCAKCSSWTQCVIGRHDVRFFQRAHQPPCSECYRSCTARQGHKVSASTLVESQVSKLTASMWYEDMQAKNGDIAIHGGQAIIDDHACRLESAEQKAGTRA